ncbi:hypothetical protein V6N13_104725 [Hibiscus sabdariffa]
MDRGKKPLETVGEWTTIPKKPNKGIQRPQYPNQGFVQVPTSVMYYPNSGYYVPYPTVRQPIGNMPQIATPLAVNPLPCSQNSQWSQNPKSTYQASYAEIIKKAEELLKPQHSQEIKDFYNPGLELDLYNLINEVWKSHITI